MSGRSCKTWTGKREDHPGIKRKKKMLQTLMGKLEGGNTMVTRGEDRRGVLSPRGSKPSTDLRKGEYEGLLRCLEGDQNLLPRAVRLFEIVRETLISEEMVILYRSVEEKMGDIYIEKGRTYGMRGEP